MPTTSTIEAFRIVRQSHGDGIGFEIAHVQELDTSVDAWQDVASVLPAHLERWDDDAIALWGRDVINERMRSW